MISKKDINLLLEGKAIGITRSGIKIVDMIKIINIVNNKNTVLLPYKCLLNNNKLLYLNKTCNFYLYGNEKSEYDIIEIELI
jgi:hypothetical protein